MRLKARTAQRPRDAPDHLPFIHETFRQNKTFLREQISLNIVLPEGMMEDNPVEKRSDLVNGLIERKKNNVQRRLAQLETINNQLRIAKNLKLMNPKHVRESQ